jgi:hypothetical protein
MPNKKTIGRRVALIAAGASPEMAALPLRLQPLELMLDVLNDASLPLDVRLNAARWAAPYCHHHRGQIDVSDAARPLVVQILKFAAPPAELADAAPTIEHDPRDATAPPD